MAIRRAKVVGIGDSILLGSHVNPGEEYFALASTASTMFTFVNLGEGSAVLAGSAQVAGAVSAYESTRDMNICLVAFGANDGASTNSTGFIATLAAACSSLRTAGFKIAVATMLPCGSYASSAFREAINTTLRNTSSLYDRLVDWGHSTSTMGIESAKSDTSLYLEADAVHPTAGGNVLLEPYLTSALRALATWGAMGFGRRF